MKRKIAKLIVCTSLLSLVATGCGAKATANTDGNEATTVAETNTEALLEATTASVEAVTETTLELTKQLSNNKTEYAPTQITQTAEPAYTYTDAELAMYAAAAVNVRTLPSVDSKKLGSLSKNQQVITTGTCNETGWFRIIYADAIGYVSNKYLTTAAPVAVTPAQTAVAAPVTPVAAVTAPITGPVPQAPQSSIRDGFDLSTQEGLMGWLEAGHSSTEIIDEDPNITKCTTTYSFDRAAGEEIFALVNAERVSIGIPALIWNEDLYEIAMQRCIENDNHAGMRAGTSENCGLNISITANMHKGFYNSPGHHANYLSGSWSYGAVAIRRGSTFSPTTGAEFPSTVCYEVFSK